MPIGPYPDFAACVTAMQKKGKSADSAKAMCGEMEKQMMNASVSITTTTSKDNKLFVKAFLLDASLNINKWRVTKDSIDKNINSFIGKPLVLTEQFDHPTPSEGQPESLNHWLSYQESFRVGTIIDITTKNNPATGNPAYYAIVEVTNEDLKQSLKDNAVPLYVSPAIAELVPNSAVAARTIPSINGDAIANWTGVHLAIVDEPAFGVKKAVISDQCGGNQEGCLLQLRKAHIDRHGIGKCGFCVKKALNKYKILRELALKVSDDAASSHAQLTNTSHTTTPTQNLVGNYRKMSQLEPTDPSTSPQAPSAVTPQQEQQQEVIERVERPNTLTNTKAPIQHPPSTTGIHELTELVQRLKQENELLKIKNEELNNVKDTISERIAAIETERRRERIERIITPDIIRDDKTRLDKIKYFVSSSIPLEQIEELYKDIKVTLRKASVSQQRAGGRVPYFGSSLGTGGVASSALQQQNSGASIDEETGLTPLQKQLAVLRGGP